MALYIKFVGPNGEPTGDVARTTGFIWPGPGPGEVVDPDWNPAPACGRGLHAVPWRDAFPDRVAQVLKIPSVKFLVLEADEKEAVVIPRTQGRSDPYEGKKVKMQKCRVLKEASTLDEAKEFCRLME